MTVPVLTINESDPGGGAGIQADLKTFHQHGLYGMAVVSQITVQNTQSIFRCEPLDAKLVLAQFDAVVVDIRPAAIKIGDLGSAVAIEALGARLATVDCPVVVDPDLITRHGTPRLGDDAFAALREHLLPHAFLLTANLHEAGALLGRARPGDDELEAVAEALAALGPRHVVVKGDPARPRAEDVHYGGGVARRLSAERHATTAVHGTGCVLSAALTARLALGTPVDQAVIEAKKFITRAIRTPPGLGFGTGPVNMHAEA